MTERVMNIDALPAYFVTTFHTKKARIHADNRTMTIEPITESAENNKRSSANILCGILADCPEMSVDKFLERKHADKELDL